MHEMNDVEIERRLHPTHSNRGVCGNPIIDRAVLGDVIGWTATAQNDAACADGSKEARKNHGLAL